MEHKNFSFRQRLKIISMFQTSFQFLLPFTKAPHLSSPSIKNPSGVHDDNHRKTLSLILNLF